MQYSTLYHALELLAPVQRGLSAVWTEDLVAVSGQPALVPERKLLRQDLSEALARMRLGSDQADASVSDHVLCARLLNHLGRHSEASELCGSSVAAHPEAWSLYPAWAEALQALGRTDEAAALVQSVLEHHADEARFAHSLRLMLPVLYSSEAEIGVWRGRYALALDELIRGVDLADQDAVARAVSGISDQFYLAYQGQDDRALQEQYGQFVQDLLRVHSPEYSQPLPLPPARSGLRTRVGFLSGRLCFHTVGKLFLGWLQHLDREQFEVFAYHVGEDWDFVTEESKRAADYFRHLPGDPGTVCEEVVADNLHVLVFLDVGMDSRTTRLAGQRLAPVQCVTWGHPVTTGLPTIDYFLSSALMEPPDGDSHYSETLVRLPGVGVSVPAPYLSSPAPVRAEFGLSEAAVVYLSPQSLFKYLPQYDFVLVEIARRVPKAQFVFLERPNEVIARLFRERLLSSFDGAGLDGERYLVTLPRQRYSDYLRLNRVSDVFLDTLGWSGGMSTLEALGCGLPVVTCPGEFMRGRHTLGFLRQLGVLDTVAASPEAYVDIAVRLGHDEAWRQDVKTRIAANADRLYDDRGCVTGLERFLWAAAQQHCPPPGAVDG